VTLNAERFKHIERLARKIAGDSTDVLTVERARTLAQEEYELALIRQAKVALISRVMASGAFETPDAVEPNQVKRLIKGAQAWRVRCSRTIRNSGNANRTGAHRRSDTAGAARINEA
jgi:hypothetical protein